MSRKRLSDQIRDAVDASGMSRYRICKTIGLNQGAMSRFMSGKGGLSLEFIDKLADLVGLWVVRHGDERPQARGVQRRASLKADAKNRARRANEKTLEG